jgi:hypothetical protein
MFLFVLLQKITFPDVEFLTDEMRDEEEQNMLCLDEACLRAPDGEKVGFLLPSAGDGDSVTQFCVHVRHGKVFHLYVSFKSEADIRAELSSFNFANVDGEELDEDSAEYKNLQRVRIIKELVASKLCRAVSIFTLLEDSLISLLLIQAEADQMMPKVPSFLHRLAPRTLSYANAFARWCN